MEEELANFLRLDFIRLSYDEYRRRDVRFYYIFIVFSSFVSFHFLSYIFLWFGIFSLILFFMHWLELVLFLFGQERILNLSYETKYHIASNCKEIFHERIYGCITWRILFWKGSSDICQHLPFVFISFLIFLSLWIDPGILSLLSYWCLFFEGKIKKKFCS